MSSPSSTSPAFGEPLPIRAAPEILKFVARRRSASALSLRGPGPSPSQLKTLIALAARAPDHGKLAPWRFVVLQGAAKAAFVAGLEKIADERDDAVKTLAELAKIKVPPLTVAVISTCVDGDIPEWEQRLSAGAVCTLLILSAQAMGFGANWITDWYAYDAKATAWLGLTPGERVAGFVHIGTAAEDPLERVRPDPASLTREWVPQRPL